MPQKHLATALIVTAFLTLLKCVHVEYPDTVFNTPDITKLIRTKEPIWTFFETGSSRVSCKVDVMITMNERAVLFRRLYIYGGKNMLKIIGDFLTTSTKRGCAFGLMGLLLTKLSRSPSYLATTAAQWL
ncbi:hypothetical protein MRX96_032608 [Rhipicephalus microplus]|uniref:Putative lipocalin n=1 Tax=Rhipicephalus microplus TaxID=6941 RepID=A0A6G5A2T4_RHIMP